MDLLLNFHKELSDKEQYSSISYISDVWLPEVTLVIVVIVIVIIIIYNLHVHVSYHSLHITGIN